MPKCGTCKVSLQAANDFINCDKCSKSYHYLCTNLGDYTIKLHKKNPYKPWRCQNCVEKYCVDCNKIFPENNQGSICCDKCSYWYHLDCSGLSDSEFEYHKSNPDAYWACKKCIKNFCKKCDASVFHKTNIKCCVCHYTFHFSCMKIPQSYKNDVQFNKNWICVNCKPTVFPFAKIDNKKVLELSDHKLEKFSRDNLSVSNLSSVCRICEKRLTKNNKGIPCSSCKSRIHVKCANTRVKDFHIHRGNWECQNCMKENYPFTEMETRALSELQFNSVSTPAESRFKPVVSVDEKLKLMLSYSKHSPWYAYTHPNESEHDFFTAEFEEPSRPNFDYYDIDEFKKVKTLWNKKKSLGIFHTNISSLQANVNSLEDLLHDLDYSFDIIALSETWNPEKTRENFLPKRIDGYLEYHGVEGSSMKGGCGFYVKDNFTPIPRSDLEFKISDIGSECENCWIELVNNSGPNVLVGVFYKHPSRENSLFLTKLKSTLSKINREKKKTIICGDFNLNLLNFEHDKHTGSFLSTMFQNNFQPCIMEPTRITNANKPSLVDNIFVNTFDDPTCGNILEHISYDHLPNFVILDHEHKNKKQSVKKRDKKNFDQEKFLADLLNDGNLLLRLLNEKDSDSACAHFIKEFVAALDTHQPMRELSKKEKKILAKPWLTTGLLKSISKKRSLFKKFKNDKLKDKTTDTYQQYKFYTDQINKLKRICMRDYYQNFFTQNFKNSKQIWKGINSLLNRHKKQQNTIYLEDNGFISDPSKVANKFNDFFLNVAEKLSAKIENKNSKPQDYLKNPNKSKFYLKEITSDEVEPVINQLDSKKVVTSTIFLLK